MSTTEGNSQNTTAALAAEILGPNHHLVFGRPKSEASEQDVVKEEERLSAVSGLSEHMAKLDSTRQVVKPLPSVPASQVTRSASFSTGDDKSINKAPVRANSTGSSTGVPAFPAGEAVKSYRVSMFLEDLQGVNAFERRSTPNASGRASRNQHQVDWPLPTPTGSPMLEKRPRSQPGLQPRGPAEAPSAVTMSQQQTADVPIAIVSPEARKSPRMSLLPRFLRTKSPEATDSTAPSANKGNAKVDSTANANARTRILARESKGEATSPSSFFDDESSDGDSDGDGEDSQIGSAQQALVARQGTIRKVELKEMLHSTPPVPVHRAMPAPASKGQPVQRADKVGITEGSNLRGLHTGPPTGIAKDVTSSVGLWKAPNPFVMNQNDSESSIDRSYASGLRPKPTRKVSFPQPGPLEVKPQHRFLRQSIISTPYPSDDNQGRERILPTKGRRRSVKQQETGGQASTIALVKYDRGNTQPKVSRIAVPASQSVTVSDDVEKGFPMIQATMIKDFDDEKLFKLIKTEYAKMCGTFKRIASARSVRGIRLLSYRSNSQLASRHAKSVHFQMGEAENVTAEMRILLLFRSPRKGRKRHEWTQWIHDQPANSRDAENSDVDKLALEIAEDWSPGTIAFAFGIVCVCSVAAMLLWIFLGKGGNRLALDNALGPFGQVSEAKIGYGTAASRVGVGAMLGLFVLSLGWAMLAAWMLVSWLVV